MEWNLQEIRQQLDAIDDQMLALFADRMRLVSQVAAYKREHGLPVFDAAREAAARGEVWLAQIGDIRFPQDFYMVVHRDKYLTGAALRFMELVRRSAASFLYGGRGN